MKVYGVYGNKEVPYKEVIRTPPSNNGEIVRPDINLRIAVS